MSALISVLCIACGKAVRRQISELRRYPTVYCNKACRGEVATRLASVRLWTKSKANAKRCLEWQGAVSSDGYGLACLRGRRTYAHVAAWTLVNGRPPAGIHVCHRCDNRLCVNPKHLILGTAMDNWNDMRAKGRHRHIAGHVAAAIRASTGTTAEIAKVHGVSARTVRNHRRPPVADTAEKPEGTL